MRLITIGPPNGAHGGAIATAMDCFLSDCAYSEFGWGYFTKMLSIRYRIPAPLNSVACFENVKIFENNQQSKRSIIVRGQLTNGNGLIYCEAVGEFASKNPNPPSIHKMRSLFGTTTNKTKEQVREDFLMFMKNGKL
jgi:hypothetical protein